MTDAGWQVIGTTSSNASQSRQGDCVPCEEFVITQPTVVVVGKVQFRTQDTHIDKEIPDGSPHLNV